MIVYILKEYKTPTQRKHSKLILFETYHTLLTYFTEQLELQRQEKKPSSWRVESMDLPLGASDIYQVAKLNELTALNKVWSNLIIWTTPEECSSLETPKKSKTK